MHTAEERFHATTDTTRRSGEAHMRTWDGSELFYRHWLPATPCDRAVVLFHGGHEHSGRFQELVEQLDLADFAIFAWDARGHGFSPGSRGHARHFLDYVRDAEAFVRHLSAEYRIPPDRMALIGHSVGSVIAATWVNDYAPPVRAMVLGSPALDIKLYVPAALPGLRLLQRLRPDAHVNSYVKPGMLTHDQAEAAARRVDPLISPRIAVRVLTSLFDTAARLIESANGIQVPTLILSAGSDRVVHTQAQRRLFDNLGSREKAFLSLPGFYHEIFHERDRHIPIAEAREFILRQFSHPHTRKPTRVAEIDADSGTCNQDRYRQLQQPLAPLSPPRWKFASIRFGLNSLGRLSEGVRLGWESGFDSGRTLDYVYRNQPRGWGPLGRIIDRRYLDSAGWAGIRQRRLHLETQLNQAIDALSAPGKALHIVDLAGGPGRYLCEVMRQRQDPAISAVCRDRDLSGLAEGRELAHASGVTRLLHEPGDAFDPDSIATLSARPDIVIVSGFYELFDDNALVLRSLRAIHRQMRPGGRLIYTNQPHHPQLELIARTLINRDGDPWVMRLRPQSEINRLVSQAGFTPQSQLQDDDGIFTVSCALREA